MRPSQSAKNHYSCNDPTTGIANDRVSAKWSENVNVNGSGSATVSSNVNEHTEGKNERKKSWRASASHWRREINGPHWLLPSRRLQPPSLPRR
jgi:hypothetical protein